MSTVIIFQDKNWQCYLLHFAFQMLIHLMMKFNVYEGLSYKMGTGWIRSIKPKKKKSPMLTRPQQKETLPGMLAVPDIPIPEIESRCMGTPWNYFGSAGNVPTQILIPASLLKGRGISPFLPPLLARRLELLRMGAHANQGLPLEAAPRWLPHWQGRRGFRPPFLPLLARCLESLLMGSLHRRLPL